jgi:hypothetical protein
MLRFLTVAASCCAALAFTAPPLSAQWFSRANDCDCAAPMAYNISSPTVCAPVVQTQCMQPVMQTVYRQVPVVEYQPTRQTVKKPVIETKYVDQAVTEYKPVTETKYVEVPTVSYQDVQECQTVYRNMGYWQTRNEPICKTSPCQYDNRPGFIGWMNRTSLELTNALTPNYRTSREYVPQTIAQTVPVTRRVAIQGSRQVSYNVTNMVAYQTTRKVAVNETKWIDEEVTVMKPTTVVKTMAVGTQITYQPLGGTATALRPQPETTINARGNTPTRTANDPFPPNSNPNRVNPNTRGAVDPQPKRDTLVPTSHRYSSELATRPAVREPKSPEPATLTIPTVARASGWVARTNKAAEISVAENDR